MYSIITNSQSQVISSLCDNTCNLRSQILESQVISPPCDNTCNLRSHILNHTLCSLSVMTYVLQDHTFSIKSYIPSLGKHMYCKITKAQSQVMSSLCENTCILKSHVLNLYCLRFDIDFYIKLMSGIGRQIQI